MYKTAITTPNGNEVTLSHNRFDPFPKPVPANRSMIGAAVTASKTGHFDTTSANSSTSTTVKTPSK